jgi:hypothetical protein
VCAQHAAGLGVKNRLMPRELAASVLQALCIRNSNDNNSQETALAKLVGISSMRLLGYAWSSWTTGRNKQMMVQWLEHM